MLRKNYIPLDVRARILIDSNNDDDDFLILVRSAGGLDDREEVQAASNEREQCRDGTIGTSLTFCVSLEI